MERSSKRGKIPQQDWPSIIQRYEAGETLANIARTYDCSPPAISYIVGRSRARDPSGENAGPGAVEQSEPQLVKAPGKELGVEAEGQDGPAVTGPSAGDEETPLSNPVEGLRSEQRQIELRGQPNHHPGDNPDLRKHVVVRDGSGAQHDASLTGDGSPSHASAPAAVPFNSEPRRTLHLSLPQEGVYRSDAQQQTAPGSDPFRSPEPRADRPTGGQHQGYPRPAPSVANGRPLSLATEPQKAKGADTFIDQELRERVNSDITAFLAAFDAALASDTPESRAGLRDATDRLLRAGARTRIELERLEARVPLPPRDGHALSAWRPR
jgi:hypothetical protein